MKELADAGHEHQHTHQTVHHRRNARQQAHRRLQEVTHAPGRKLGDVHRRKEAHRHAEDDRARRAVDAREDERQDCLSLLLC